MVCHAYLPAFPQASTYASIYNEAVKEYKAGRYKEASILFNSYLSPQLNVQLPITAQLPAFNDKPLFVYAIMYEAMCLERSGDIEDAAIIYKILAERYSGTVIGNEAQKALKHPQVAKIISQKFPGTTRSAQLDSLPKETWIPFKRFGNLMLVEGYKIGRAHV